MQTTPQLAEIPKFCWTPAAIEPTIRDYYDSRDELLAPIACPDPGASCKLLLPTVVGLGWWAVDVCGARGGRLKVSCG